MVMEGDKPMSEMEILQIITSGNSIAIWFLFVWQLSEYLKRKRQLTAKG